MKALLWKAIQLFFKKEINQLIGDEKRQHLRQQQEEATNGTMFNYPVGTKIISQSNEPDELLIAHVVRHEFIHDDVMLVVQNSEGREFALLDKAPAIWAQEREDALLKLSWDERWNVMSKYDYYIDTETKQHKESDEYKNRLNIKT